MHRLPNWPLSAELIPDPLTETLASWKVSGVSEVKFVELKKRHLGETYCFGSFVASSNCPLWAKMWRWDF